MLVGYCFPLLLTALAHKSFWHHNSTDWNFPAGHTCFAAATYHNPTDWNFPAGHTCFAAATYDYRRLYSL